MSANDSKILSPLKRKEKIIKLTESIKVRYLAIVFVFFILLIAYFFDAELSFYWLGFIFAGSLVVNYFIGELYKREKGIIFLPYLGILIDLIAITLLIFITGGIDSPFIFLYFIEVIAINVHVNTWTSIWATLIIIILLSLMLLFSASLAQIPIKICPSHQESIGGIIIFFTSLVSTLILSIYIMSTVANRLKIVEQELLKANKNLNEQYLQLQEVDNLKTEFVSIASHQLRTPLSAIKWSLKMLLDGEFGSLNPSQSDLMRKGYASNERMITLVNDLLNISRIEQNKFSYKFTPEKLTYIISQIINEIQQIADNKKINLLVKWPAEELPTIKLDKEKIKLALQNILDNAVKYTPSGGQVTIDIKNDKLNIVITIIDNGIGIPPDQQNKLFSKFFRGDNAIKLQTEGSGLGLFIVKSIIYKHRGTIKINSRLNKGTTVIITLPTNKK